MTEAAPWSDHDTCPGADTPLAVLSAHSANQRRQLADLQRRHQATLYELAMVRADAAISSGFAQTWGADAHRAESERDAYAAALTRIRVLCRGATNSNALDAWDIADAALAGAKSAAVTTDTENEAQGH